MKIVTGKVEIHRDITADAEFLNVPWTLYENDNTFVKEGAQAFPLDTPREAITEFLMRVIKTHQENVALHTAAAAQQAQVDAANATADSFSNLSVEG